MKIFSTFIIILLSATLIFAGKPEKSVSKTRLSGSVTISGAFALYPLTVRWAEEFKKEYPNVKFDISAGGAGKGITDVLSSIVDIGLVSREINKEEFKKGAFPFAVAKDAVVPTISNSNPNLKELLEKGIKKDAFINTWVTGRYKQWSKIANINNSAPVHIYTRSDACGAAETWAKYLGKKQEDLLGVGVFGDPGLAQAVKKDPLGIGYNNIVYVFDSKTKKQTNGVRIVPIDLNGNGKVDNDENFYGDVNQLIDAIADGKYPSPPARDLYFVTKGKPQNQAATEFIKWVLTEGQKYIQDAGYIKLPAKKIETELQKLDSYASK